MTVEYAQAMKARAMAMDEDEISLHRGLELDLPKRNTSSTWSRLVPFSDLQCFLQMNSLTSVFFFPPFFFFPFQTSFQRFLSAFLELDTLIRVFDEKFSSWDCLFFTFSPALLCVIYFWTFSSNILSHSMFSNPDEDDLFVKKKGERTSPCVTFVTFFVSQVWRLPPFPGTVTCLLRSTTRFDWKRPGRRRKSPSSVLLTLATFSRVVRFWAASTCLALARGWRGDSGE